MGHGHKHNPDGTPITSTGAGDEWAFFNQAVTKGNVDMVIDGKDVTMSTADYLAAVSARASKKIKKEDAAKKKATESKRLMLYLAAGGVGILFLRGM